MTLLQLQYFCAVYELRNITWVARDIHVTRTAISQALSDLESDLGSKLFERNADGLVPTANGDYLYTQALSMLDTASRISTFMSSPVERKNALSVSIVPLLGVCAFPGLCTGFRHLHPEIDLKWYDTAETNARSELKLGQSDLAICVSRSTDYQSFESLNLFDTELKYYVAASHPLASSPFVTFDTIRDIPSAHMILEYSQERILASFPQYSQYLQNVRTFTIQILTFADLVAAGEVGGLTYSGLGRRFGGLAELPLSPRITLPVRLLWRRDDEHSRERELFTAYLRDYLAWEQP